jgi:hypothetical protein
MPNDQPTPRSDQSIKLSVTVKRRLEGKYKDRAALKKIDAERQHWIDEDATRGIQTLHVAVDDPADITMKRLRVTPVSGDITPGKIKEAIDDLWKKLTPQYLVLFGGHDIVPMFEVPNPTSEWKGDTDKTVLTDNPYASPFPFSSDPNSYVVPDRAIGRIPDMLGDSDPAWFVDYLKTASKWKSRDASIYNCPYAICTSEAKVAGTGFMQKAFAKPTLPLFICPPTSDMSTHARHRLSARLHTIKCHGNKRDATFWGFLRSDEDKKEHPCPAMTSATLGPRLKRSTVVAAMCCYGAQIFSPKDRHAKKRGQWPMASTYLRKGALGFVGSTMMAWVGRSEMGPADWLVAAYLKNVLEGASIGRAFLASKQDYHSYYATGGKVIGIEDMKTLIEYVLLGDPSIHPVSSWASSACDLAVQERRQRRVARAKLATGIREFLPIRSPATRLQRGMAKDVFKSAQKEIGEDTVKKLKKFGIKPTAVQVKRVDVRLPTSPETSQDPSARKRQSLEFYWSGQRYRGGHKQLCSLKAETDRKGTLWSTSVMYSS